MPSSEGGVWEGGNYARGKFGRDFHLIIMGLGYGAGKRESERVCEKERNTVSFHGIKTYCYD